MSPPDPNQGDDVRSLFSMLGKDRDAGRYRDFDTGLPPLPPRPAPAPARTAAPEPEPTAEAPAAAAMPPPAPAAPVFDAPPVAGMPAVPARLPRDAGEPARHWLDEAGAEAAPTASVAPTAPAPGAASPPGASPERRLDERPLDAVFRRALGAQGDSDIGASLRRIGRS
ncbi:hypothetical protein LDO31_10025 [Luteimonas sp. XNQY3]|nr:hypothetical protein [Luteimonas sp. XNQY3]MCD9006566.1 hypothetical protein [Luteimonas sp. XNQY3]